MKELKLIITINKPIKEVFDFTINPKNTPLWIGSIVHEETNEWPIKVGTIYKNTNPLGVWNSYKVTELEMYKMFVFSSTDSTYHVKYTFTEIDKNSCKLEYYEWVDGGELEEPFTISTLQKLKNTIENS